MAWKKEIQIAILVALLVPFDPFARLVNTHSLGVISLKNNVID